MSRLDWAIVVLCGVVIGEVIYIADSKRDACDKSGGLMVSNGAGYECVKISKLRKMV